MIHIFFVEIDTLFICVVLIRRCSPFMKMTATWQDIPFHNLKNDFIWPFEML